MFAQSSDPRAGVPGLSQLAAAGGEGLALPPPLPGMSVEVSGPEAAEAPSLEVPKPSGLEPGSSTYDLKPLTPKSKYVKLNVGGWLHCTTLHTLTGQDTMLKAMFSGRVEERTDAEGMRATLSRAPRHPPDSQIPFPQVFMAKSHVPCQPLLPSSQFVLISLQSPLPVAFLLSPSKSPSCPSPSSLAITNLYGIPSPARRCGK